MTLHNSPLRRYEFENDQMVLFESHSHPLIPKPIFDMHLPPELGVVLSGKMARYTDGIRTELPRGGVWLANSLELHGRQAIEKNSRVAVFTISTDFFHNMVIPGVDNHFWQTPFNTPAALRPLLIDETFASLAERLISSLAAGGSQEILSAKIQLTLLEIILHVNQLGKFKTEGCTDVTDFGRLRPALDLIYRLNHPAGTAAAAKLCKLSVSRFSQLFLQATGMSFRKFSLRHRLSQVAHDLKSEHSSLDELADKWGFATKSHLLNRFKEHYNITPNLYRKSSSR